MNDWRKPCEHGFWDFHTVPVPCPGHSAFNFDGERIATSCTVLHYAQCPGGSPVTTADLEGEKVWWCSLNEKTSPWQPLNCEQEPDNKCGYRLLIPIPDPQAATEEI